MLPKAVSRKAANQNIKPLLLILGQMFRIEIINDPIFTDSLDTIRKLTPQMITCMGGVTQEL